VQLAAWTGALRDVWWWTQGLLLGLGLAGLLAITVGNRRQPHPFRVVMRRLGAAAWMTLALATLAVVLAGGQPAMSREIALVGSLAWTVFFASVLLLFPFLSRSRQVWREFALLAGIATLAASLHLLFVALFSLGELASLLLAAVVAAAAYGAGRHWVMDRLLGRARPSTERVFEQLYRVARELQQHPTRHTELLTQLLRDLFEPLQTKRLQRATTRARVASDGSALLVPLQDAKGQKQALLLRFASRGQRIFTREDVRLAEVVVEQLRRAAAYDAAVEQGRSEERARIAQDLHDDIGARLLTLMYQAQTPEMEDYIRHTLQDLKTLTRGLAASQHRLSHAAAEWKADLGQRLSAASIDLVWHFSTDEDFELGVVHWSALTRVLRELVSNAIAHARATRLEISFVVERGALTLKVADDGSGRAPESWSHGLGLGGVRKRVKQLGGQVAWREREAGGIVCEVRVPELGSR
jgi:signal transduction histidine kinase